MQWDKLEASLLWPINLWCTNYISRKIIGAFEVVYISITQYQNKCLKYACMHVCQLDYAGPMAPKWLAYGSKLHT